MTLSDWLGVYVATLAAVLTARHFDALWSLVWPTLTNEDARILRDGPTTPLFPDAKHIRAEFDRQIKELREAEPDKNVRSQYRKTTKRTTRKAKP